MSSTSSDHSPVFADSSHSLDPLRRLDPAKIPIAETPDENTEKEINDYDRQMQKATVYDKVQNIKLRKKFAWALFWLTVGWLIAIYFAVFLVGFGGVWKFSFTLSDKVLIALITSTTINVLGLFTIVIRNLFPNKDGKSKS